MTIRPSDSLVTADLVVALLSIDPKGLGGVWVRARHGPQKKLLEKALAALPYPSVKVSPSMDDLALFGGLDVSESLLTGRPAYRDGVITSGYTIKIAGIENTDTRRQTRIASESDDSGLLVLLDEGAEDDPLPHEALRDRCAFFLDEAQAFAGGHQTDTAGLTSAHVTLTEDQLTCLAIGAARAGIAGLRPLIFAANAARALAALDQSDSVDDAHLCTAARLVFAHRALATNDADEQPEQEPDNPNDEQRENAERESSPEVTNLPEELIIEAMRTALPGDVLADLVARSHASAGAGRGDERVSAQRGRPLPSRPGRLDGRGRPDILATLAAAAPWQRLRGGTSGRLEIRPDDVRVRRFREQSERLILFLVDASGSAALARLAEGKGAVELLLSRSYAERDFASMIVFRNATAELVLPPTRALARAKNALTGLPAGGSTPLASGLKLAFEVCSQARRKGQTPQIVLISDGRANRTLAGEGDRASAQIEATSMARHLRAAGIPVTLLDTGRRQSRELVALSETLASPVIELPRRLNASAGEAIATAIDTQR